MPPFLFLSETGFRFRKATSHWLSYSWHPGAAAVLCWKLNDLMRYQRSQIIDCVHHR